MERLSGHHFFIYIIYNELITCLYSMKETQMEIIHIQPFCEVVNIEIHTIECNTTDEEIMHLPLPSLFEFFIWEFADILFNHDIDVE
jgi:hypothetical protein